MPHTARIERVFICARRRLAFADARWQAGEYATATRAAPFTYTSRSMHRALKIISDSSAREKRASAPSRQSIARAIFRHYR